MALSGTFAAVGLSAEITALSGNVDINLRATDDGGFNIVLEVSYDAGTSFTSLHDFGNNISQANKIMVAGDTTAVYRLRCRSLTAAGVVYYIGQA